MGTSSCQRIVVLIVDDDAAFRNGVVENLADDGHVVYECASPTEVTPGQLNAASIVLTDFHMPDIDGVRFADRVHRARTDLAILLVTSYWTVEVEAAVATRPYLHLRRKPIDYDDLHARIHELTIAG